MGIIQQSNLPNINLDLINYISVWTFTHSCISDENREPIVNQEVIDTTVKILNNLIRLDNIEGEINYSRIFEELEKYSVEMLKIKSLNYYYSSKRTS